jgi:aspartate aminotransferase
MLFPSLPVAPPDPILGLGAKFLADSRPDKINLSVGVYQDAAGHTPILASVRQAAARLLESETSKSYLGIAGHPGFLELAAGLVLGEAWRPERSVALQAPGGTGACRVAAELMASKLGSRRVWVSDPTWANHAAIFAAAGLQVLTHRYLDASRTRLDFEGMLDQLRTEARPGDIICLHACCHNPTGIDLTPPQWLELGAFVAEQQIFPLVDFAYLGFGDGLEADRLGVQQLLGQVPEALVCASFSKNFGLYSERIGIVLGIADSAAAANALGSQLKVVVRANYSNPPRHGAALVHSVLVDPELRTLWHSELDAMRQRISDMRQEFVARMAILQPSHDFEFLLRQKGMFSFSGLNPLQVDWLQAQRAVYLVGSGRINVAGMTPENLPRLTQAIAEALQLASSA